MFTGKMSADATTGSPPNFDDTPELNCPNCGAPLPAKGAPCPHCSRSALSIWGRSRTVFLSLSALLLIPMFTVTGVVVRLFHAKQASIAADWEKAGNVNLQTRHAAVAIEDFRNSLLYAPDNSKLQLELAEALAAQGQLEEAESYLFNLRTADPENSMINLELARISARQGDVNAAITFYHDATFGQWPESAHANQIAAWKELIEFLMQHGRMDQARAEALVMSADNPADPEVRNAVAAYLSQTGDSQSALNEYQSVLRLAPNDTNALTGAGNAALALNQFSEADRYFARAIQHGAKAPEVAEDRDVSAAAAELDPFNARLSERERDARIIEIFNAADQRAQSCLPALATGGSSVPNNLKPLAAQRAALPAKLALSTFNAHPEYADQALNWAFAIEQAISPQCAGTLADHAIALLARENKES
jgi:Flp pilus assembly protein TadD